MNAFNTSAKHCLSALLLGIVFPVLAAENKAQWQHYGADLAGSRYASEVLISPDNVKNLSQEWVFRTGDITHGDDFFGRESSFKATPVYIANKLVFTSGFNRVYAVNPASGTLAWMFDPEVDFGIEYSEMFSSRGVSTWSDTSVESGVCSVRILLGTLDARLIALDAATGKLCTQFGNNGQVDLSTDVLNYRRGQYSQTSPATVVNDVVIVGSSVGDNGATDIDSGVVRGYDVRSGELLWKWDPIPRRTDRPESSTWENSSWQNTGGANVWSSMAADAERNLVYLPTTSPAPDFFGGERLGDNAWSNSIVALDVATGKFRWAYQTVKHDLWDYDIAAQPLLTDIEINGETIPLLVLAAKTGFVFFLNRVTGEPVFPIEQRAVPASDVPGERAAATQAFTSLRLHPEPTSLPALFDYSAEHTSFCENLIEGARFEGVFTPPSLAGTVLYPGNPGGVNWGSMSLQKDRDMAFAVVNRWPTLVKLLPRTEFNRLRSSGIHNGTEAQYTEQNGTPFGMVRFELYKRYPEGSVPCFEGPWSTLVGIDLAQGTLAWEVPIGTSPAVRDDPVASKWGGLVNYGGPLTTGGGIIFVGTRNDRTLHGLDARNGEELWKQSLPAEVLATPMAYMHKGSSYVVIAAGGSTAGGERGDYLVAFKLN